MYMTAVTHRVRLYKQSLGPKAQLLASASSLYLLHFRKVKVVSSLLQVKDKRARPGNLQSIVPPSPPLQRYCTLLTILFLSTLLFFTLLFCSWARPRRGPPPRLTKCLGLHVRLQSVVSFTTGLRSVAAGWRQIQKAGVGVETQVDCSLHDASEATLWLRFCCSFFPPCCNRSLTK